MPTKTPIGIVGATGYTGVELVRLLSNHPNAEIKALTSRQYIGQAFSQVFPAFFGLCDLKCEELNVDAIAQKIKVVFLCLPHHEAMETAAAFRKKDVVVIDLSADFRIKDSVTYEKWYGSHSQKSLINEAVYGLPELHRKEIKQAKLIASPGCYATTNILGLAPLLQKGLIDPNNIICDSKSGVSGAGRSASVDNLYSEVNDSFKAYKVGCHRHTPEIEQELSLLANKPVTLLFSPHLVPMDRGIFSTIYAQPTTKLSTKDILKIYQDFYSNETFVKVLPEEAMPATKNVRGTNFCHISPLYDERTGKIIILAALDNLTKGASGQAIQSFNILSGFDETTGLTQAALLP